jgi:hypothetical protein
VLRARDEIDQTEREAADGLVKTLAHPGFGGMPLDKVKRLASHVGIDAGTVSVTPYKDLQSAGGVDAYAANQKTRADEQTVHGSLAARLSGMTPQQRLRLYRWFMEHK